MPYTFDQAHKAFQNDLIRELGLDQSGLRFLKLRSLSRKATIERMYQILDRDVPTGKGNALLKAIFDSDISDSQIDGVINTIYSEDREERLSTESSLISELYQLDHFDWGGLHQNSLEKTIVDNYVKKIQSYNELNRCIENQLFNSMKSYVLSSWYNHWTSIIIEDIFKDHPDILPAVGLIKKVDFFVRGIPYDLKVTYMPEGYVKERRRSEGLRPELTLLKQFARRSDLHIDTNLPDAKLLENLWKQVSDYPSEEATELIDSFTAFRNDLVSELRTSPTNLIKWLYENQGVRRFDASNRLFLVLVDSVDFFASWKLKRAKDLITQTVSNHFSTHSGEIGHNISFEWEDETYETTSDLVLVEKQ